MNENIKPKLISGKIYKKILRSELKKKKISSKIVVYAKKNIIDNWIFLLILSFILFILYLKFNENKKKKESFKNNKENIINHKENELDAFKISDVTNYQQFQRSGPDIQNNILPEMIF